jgi:hypothetical protein
MTTASTLARLAVALISVGNASAALMLPKAIVAPSCPSLQAADVRDERRPEFRRLRPPRVPRRERVGCERSLASMTAR